MDFVGHYNKSEVKNKDLVCTVRYSWSLKTLHSRGSNYIKFEVFFYVHTRVITVGVVCRLAMARNDKIT
jgi:hypothetical protein